MQFSGSVRAKLSPHTVQLTFTVALRVAMIIPVFKVRKPKLKGGQWFPSGHTARKGWN